ncbi:MAG: BadF/BadG/BcrA/BcrD ATPase family protein [Hyphomicrobiales bacterium]
MSFFIGIDGGGTGCRALLCDASATTLGTGKAGPANIVSDLNGAHANITAAAQQAIQAAGLDRDIIQNVSAYLGLAGANVESAVTALSERLPFKQCHIDTDALIALEGAVGHADGAAAIIGTGSIFISRHSDKIQMLGGWGFVVSDLASGARLGRACLERSLLAHEGIVRPTDLTRKVMERFGKSQQNLVEYAWAASPGDFGSFAPLVFDHADAGDSNAEILRNDAIKTIETALAALQLDSTDRFCMLGGLGAKYSPHLSTPYKEMVKPPLSDAVNGAAALAVRCFRMGAVDADLR